MGTELLLFWGGCATMGLAFAGFAYVLGSALGAGAENYAGAYSEETARRFEDVFMFIPPRRIAEIGWSASGLVFLLIALPFIDPAKPGVMFGGLFFAALGGGLALMLPDKVLIVLKNRRRKRFNLQLVDALSSMSNSLKAGFSINQAIEGVVDTGENPISQEFQVFLQQMRVGMNFYDALQSLDKRVGSDDLTLVVNAIDIARRTGGNLTEVFDKISQTIRERMRIENRVMTLTAQGRLQGFIVGSMPLVLGTAMTILKPGIMLPFLASKIGLISVGACVGLVALGAFFISKIIKIDV